MDRAELAGRWAAALRRVAYVPRAHGEVEAELGELITAALLARDDPATATDIGARLVAAGFVEPDCLRTTLDLLGAELSRVDSRMWTVLGAVAAGFTEATRERLFGDQEDIRQALVRAKQNVERDLAASEARFRELFATSVLGMVISDLGGGVARANEALEEMLGHQRGTLFRKRLDDLFHPEEADYLRGRYAELVGGDGDQLHERTRFVHADGETAWVRVAVSVLRDADGRPDHHVTMVENITDLHLLEHRISHQATHDVLTGLPNRQSFIGRLEEALSGGHEFSVFHLGLEDFAIVNDGIGRHAGDHLLRETASRLAAITAGHEATIARLSGVEFGLLLHHGATPPDVAAVATAINEALAEPTYVDGHGVVASATVAVVRTPAGNTDPADLLRATDITLRRLKCQGRRQWGLVDADQDAHFREHYRLAASVPGAWESGELELDYQPVVTLHDRRVVAVQARLHWDHPTHGQLGHARSQEVLLDTGLSVPLGHWVLARAAERLACFGDGPRLYVDLAAEQAADPDLVAAVHAVLTDTGLPADRLEFGMPVEALCGADGHAEDNLGVLVDLGLRSVLTGFGRTRGDLTCLEDLPVHTVRMADAVVRRIAGNPEPSSLFARAVRDLVPIVRESEVSVLVAGVDTAEQAAWWTAAGADRAQGAVFGSPGLDVPTASR
ncbi:EAL domain-containing protein [Actinokineospora sp.]|uniref:EAL domain-containing protein n=1 Tax=Actinokineospora sp. TaxID=1872133 RepID=UPI004037AD4B